MRHIPLVVCVLSDLTTERIKKNGLGQGGGWATEQRLTGLDGGRDIPLHKTCEGGRQCYDIVWVIGFNNIHQRLIGSARRRPGRAEPIL